MPKEDTQFKEGNQAKKGKYKYPTEEERKKVFEALLKHAAEGYDLDSFGLLSLPAIKDYCKLFPTEFSAERLQEAIAFGKRFWEKVGMQGTIGQINGFNQKNWQFIMMNKYGMSLNQTNNVNVRGNIDITGMSDEELKEIVNE